MANRPTLLESLSLCLLAGLAAQSARAQALNDVLARMDQFAPQFSGARAAIRSTNHVQGLPDDDVESGSFLVKRAGDQAQFRIDFAQPNRYSVSVHTQTAEVYHPKINEIQEYDLRAYKDIAQKLFLLGFGTPGRDLAAHYEIRNLKRDPLEGQACTYMELTPQAPEVRKQLKSVELWISDTTHCPARQTFHMPDGSFRTVQFSGVEVNPKFGSAAFDLPKGAKRVKVN